MMLRPSGASSCAYLLKLVAIPPGIVNGCPAMSVFDTRIPPVQTKYSPMAEEAMPTSQQKARPPMQSLFATDTWLPMDSGNLRHTFELN